MAHIIGFLYLSFVPLSFEISKWALLVAGSKSFFNYRHQADIYHAYRTLLNRGFDMRNVIVMSYDDIIRDPFNKKPHMTFNRLNDDVNYYANLTIDYSFKDVNVVNFKNVLLGKSTNSTKKVLKLNEGDSLFLFMVSHGGSDLFFFPNEFLTSLDLQLVVTEILKLNIRVIIFVEACESGSLFDVWADKLKNLHVVTSTNHNEPSYAFYYSEELMAFLGDQFSINFLEDLDKSSSSTSLKNHISVVKYQTDLSHVQQFGDHELLKSNLSDFFGPNRFNKFFDDRTLDEKNHRHWPKHKPLLFNQVNYKSSKEYSSIVQYDVHKVIYGEMSKRLSLDHQFIYYLQNMTYIDKKFGLINSKLPENHYDKVLPLELDVYLSVCYLKTIEAIGSYVNIQEYPIVLSSKYIQKIKSCCYYKTLSDDQLIQLINSVFTTY